MPDFITHLPPPPDEEKMVYRLLPVRDSTALQKQNVECKQALHALQANFAKHLTRIEFHLGVTAGYLSTKPTSACIHLVRARFLVQRALSEAQRAVQH